MVNGSEQRYKPAVSVNSAIGLAGRSSYTSAEPTYGSAFADNRGAYLNGTTSWHGPMYMPSQPQTSGYNPMYLPYANSVPYGQSVGTMMPHPWYTPVSSWYPPLTSYWMPPYQPYWFQQPPMYPYAAMYGPSAAGYSGYPIGTNVNSYPATGSSTLLTGPGAYPTGGTTGANTPSYAMPGGQPNTATCPGSYVPVPSGSDRQPPVGTTYAQIPVGSY